MEILVYSVSFQIFFRVVYFRWVFVFCLLHPVPSLSASQKHTLFIHQRARDHLCTNINSHLGSQLLWLVLTNEKIPSYFLLSVCHFENTTCFLQEVFRFIKLTLSFSQQCSVTFQKFANRVMIFLNTLLVCQKCQSSGYLLFNCHVQGLIIFSVLGQENCNEEVKSLNIIEDAVKGTESSLILL